MASNFEFTVNEQSTAFLTCRFLDKNGDPAVPNTITYRVDCLTTGTAIRASTPISSPASTIEITLDSADTRIVTSTNPYEERVVTVEASYGGTDEVNEEFRFRVKNLNYVS